MNSMSNTWEEGIVGARMREEGYKMTIALASMLKQRGYPCEKVYLLPGVDWVFVMVPRDCPDETIGAIFRCVTGHVSPKAVISIETVGDPFRERFEAEFGLEERDFGRMPSGWDLGIPSSVMIAKVRRVSLALKAMLIGRGYDCRMVSLNAGVFRIFIDVSRDCPAEIVGASFGFVIAHSSRRFKIVIQTREKKLGVDGIED